MAETFIRDLGGDRFEVESAGLEPTRINPLVVDVMGEIGHDLSQKKTQSVFDLFKQGRLFDYVITVCDAASDRRCPIFPGVTQRLHWPFPDPEELTGSEEEKRDSLREIRNRIRDKIDAWVRSFD
jgi:arsenate reductase